MLKSATLAANEILEQRRRAGERVLPMAFGEAGLPVAPLLRETLREAAGRGAYGPVAGTPELRAAAAGYWARRDLPTDAEQVVAGPGSKPLLFALRLAIGGDVIVPRPSWVSYAAQAEVLGTRVWPVDTTSGAGVPDPELVARTVRLARAAGHDIRQIVVTLPDNPTGRAAPPDEVAALCRAAREHDLVIVSDEIYRDLLYPGQVLCHPVDFAPERTVVTTGLSKSMAVGGWRLGVARFPDNARGNALCAHVVGIASELWSTPPLPVQYAATVAFGEPAEIRERVAASVRLHARTAQAVADRWTAHGAHAPDPQAAFYVYPDLAPVREHLAAKWDVATSADLAELLLDRHGVGTLPGSVFGEPPEHLRLRVCTSLIYGTGDEERETALHADDPLALPSIAGALAHLDEALGDLLGTA